MKTKIQIKTFLGKVLFEYEKEDNTIRKTLENAIKAGANLTYANLRDSNLIDSDLTYANLTGSNLRGSNLRGSNLKIIKKQICPIPMEGSFIAYKKASESIVKILIPEDSKRTWNICNRKCRAEFVDVLEITKNGKQVKKAIGNHDCETVYKVGERTHADSFDNDLRKDCSHGIHFFITKEEAEDW